MLTIVDRDAKQVRNVQGCSNISPGKVQKTGEQIEGQSVVAERLAHVFQKIVSGTQPLDPKQCSPGLLGKVFEVDFFCSLGKVGKLFDRFACGNHTKPGILGREIFYQPGTLIP